MKKSLFSLFCLFALVVSTPTFVRAQDTDSGRTRKWPTPDEVVAKMDSKLSLSDDQKAKITPIIADRQEQMKALAQNSGRRRSKARQMKAIMSESDKKIEALLNDDQKKKYKDMEQEMREQAKERRAQRHSGGSD